MSELRRDPVIGRWVIISSERGGRPSDFDPEKTKPRPGFCPFCEGNEGNTPPEIMAVRDDGSEPNTPGWDIRVVSNKFPALQIEGDLVKRARGIYDTMTGVGAHEVFIETPQHDKTISTLPFEHMIKLMKIYRDRLYDLEKDRRFQYILIFRNSGQAAGASLMHPHSQLIATPTIPKRIMEELMGVRRYLDFKERCVFCDMVDEERIFGKRIVCENDEFISFNPFAARFPFESWIMPKAHEACFKCMTDEQIPKLAEVLQETIRRIDKCLNFPPYNYVLHTRPVNVEQEYVYHWHFEIIPRLTYIAGFEWGTGFYINPTPPEVSAEFLREVKL